eukprot:5068352-Pyramimonas_sp.AAC.1
MRRRWRCRGGLREARCVLRVSAGACGHLIQCIVSRRNVIPRLCALPPQPRARLGASFIMGSLVCGSCWLSCQCRRNVAMTC